MNFISKLNIAAFIILTAIGGYVAYLAWYPFPTFELKRNPVPITKEHFTPGEKIGYVFDVCWSKGYRYKMLRRLAVPKPTGTQKFIYLNESEGFIDAGCGVYEVTEATVPLDTEPGIYYIRLALQVFVNPFQTRTVLIDSVPFSVP